MSRLSKFTTLPLGASENSNDLCRIGCQSRAAHCDACCWYFPRREKLYLCSHSDYLNLESPAEIKELIEAKL